MNVVVVLPTYNERDNILELVPQIERVFQSSGILGWIVVVDDNSLDGTIDAVEALRGGYGNIRLIVRRGERGLGSAIVRGFKEALQTLDIDVYVQMDADLSHPPSAIPELLKALEDGYDIAIASRYCEEGDALGWSPTRKLVSWAANRYATSFLGVKIRDVTTGFKAYNTRALTSLVELDLESGGYAYQVESLYELLKRGFRAVEVPFVFVNRRVGRSKLGLKNILSFAWIVLKMSFLIR